LQAGAVGVTRAKRALSPLPPATAPALTMRARTGSWAPDRTGRIEFPCPEVTAVTGHALLSIGSSRPTVKAAGAT
jgi:hypothetical protein